MEENSSLSSPQAQPPQINPTAVQPSTPPQKKSVIPFLLIIFGVLEILFCYIFFPKFASLTLNIFGNIPTATVSIIIVVIIALVQIALGIFQAVNHRMLSPKQRNISLILLITSPILTMALTAFFISMTLSSVYKEVACTADAKICPDGSSVGRTGPSCEFAPCPDETIRQGSAVEETVCARDRKECSDGNSVGRSGPSCEFIPCSDELTEYSEVSNNKHNYSVSIPTYFFELPDHGPRFKNLQTLFYTMYGVKDSDYVTTLDILKKNTDIAIHDWWEENFDALYSGNSYFPNVQRDGFQTEFVTFGNNSYFLPKNKKYPFHCYFLDGRNKIGVICPHINEDERDTVLSTFKFTN